jgi:molybdate transport system regulatory protein
MPRSAPELQPRLRFPHAGPDAFGPGKAELLRHIAATGSIAEGAAQLGMSYNRGTGGGAALTPAGEKVLELYTRMEASCRAATRTDWNALLRLLRV